MNLHVYPAVSSTALDRLRAFFMRAAGVPGRAQYCETCVCGKRYLATSAMLAAWSSSVSPALHQLNVSKMSSECHTPTDFSTLTTCAEEVELRALLSKSGQQTASL